MLTEEHANTALLALGILFVAFLLAQWTRHSSPPKPDLPDHASSFEPEQQCSRAYDGLRFADCPSCPGTICGIPMHHSAGKLATLPPE